jgi:hypothetical protein
MAGIHAMICDVFSELMTKVTVVVQQRGSDNDRRLARLVSEGRALQSVLQLCHVLAVVAMAMFAIGGEDIVE